jgi:acyl dehydratase
LFIELAPERLLAYRRAVGDSLSLYDDVGVAPPLAVAAFALGALLEEVGLPPGSLHVNEGLEYHKAVPVGARLECRAVLAQRSQRSGWIVSVLDSQLLVDGETVISARSSVMSPVNPE